MDIKYEDYLDRGTRRILELFSSADICAEERDAIASAFADELAGNIGNTEGLRDYDLLIYAASVRFVDSKISEILSKNNASYTEHETGIEYCVRQQQSFALFKRNGWTIPKVENVAPEQCAELLQKRQESISIRSKILDEDKRINELINKAEIELQISVCDKIKDIANELEKDISICKQKHISVPAIHNKDIRDVLKRVEEIRKNAEYKEAVYKGIYDNNQQIRSTVTNPISTPEQWRNLISICQKQMEYFAECESRQWKMPVVLYDRPDKIIDQYKHYIKMADLDTIITRERDSLITNKQYQEFFDHCKTQQENLTVCLQNGWKVPTLSNPAPGALSNSILAEKNKKERHRRFKRKLYLTGAVLIVIAITILVGLNKYRAGKVKIPFDASYAIGQDLDDIYNELENAGFTNIIMKQDDTGWLEANEVINVTIDNSDSYSKGGYRKPDVSVVITYSSADRVYVTDLLQDWQKKEYTEIENILKNAGFTNITLKEISTLDKQTDKLTADITFDGTSYTNEHCYLSKKAPIIVSYYLLQIGIGNDSAQFIGQDYEIVVSGLKEIGFTNVQTQEVTTGWAKRRTVIGVTVNNVDTYNSGETFSPDVRIVVKYSSNARVDITEILKNWQNTDHEILVNSLKKKGFKNIKLKSKPTENKSQNRLVASITLDNEEYISGDCYLPRSSSIEIEYYSLQIKIGQTAKQFEKNQQYTDVVRQLQSKGFTNILLKRANDIGWFPIHDKEGSIKTFTINNNRDFTETDKFNYDAEIVIVVHTLEDKGCEDIIEIEK